jgi:polysaccharide pyruvyl transferase WcaK-like protein
MLKNKMYALNVFLKEFCKRFFLKLTGKKINIGYIGGHGVANLGDDVMYFALKKSIPNYNVLTFQTIGVEKLLCFFGLSGNSFFKLIVLGGGTLINDMWFNKVERSLNFKVPVIALGTGVGSCGLEQSRAIDFSNWTKVLNQFKFVGVRGEMSKNRLISTGVNSSVVGDLALLLAIKAPQKSIKKVIGINLMDIAEYNEYWEAMIPELLKLKEEGWGFEPLVMNPNDLKYTSRFFEKLGISNKIEIIASDDEFKLKTNELTFTICVRLHGSVLSLCNNVPTVLFGYRDKCKDFMSSVDLTEFYIDLDDNNLNKLNYALDKIELLKDVKINKNIRSKVLEKALFYKKELLNMLNLNISS